MKVLSNLEFKNSTYILNKFSDFPENPVEGMTIFKENGLYIYSTNITSGQLEWLNILDFTRVNSSYKFEQSTENIEWVINHNLNTQDLFVIVYDSDGNKQVESEIQFQSDNEIKLIFSEPISGKALLFGASVLASPSNIYTKEEIDELLKNIEVSGGGSNIILPENGTDGQVLIKDSSTESGLNWSDQNKTEYPSNGVNGQVLMHDDTTEIGAKWGLIQAPHSMNIGDMGYTYSDNPPSNALFCGGLVNKTQYPELYKVIGDKFTNDNNLSDKNRLIVPEYVTSDFNTALTNVTMDLTLGENSYRSGILDNNIKVTTIGTNAGIFSGHEEIYSGWSVFNNDYYVNSSYVPNQLWMSNVSSTLEIEFLDGSRFAPYMYQIKRWNYPTYYFINWEFTGWNEETSTWDILDSHADGSSTNPSSDGTLYTISNYNNNVTYNKFRFNISNIVNYMYIDRIRIYGTKEGEDSIYDLFALPPSVEDTTGAKNYIVATSGNDRDYNFSTEERVIGTWIDGKPIYRKVISGVTSSVETTKLTNTSNIEHIISFKGVILNSGILYYVPRGYSASAYVMCNLTNNNILMTSSSDFYNKSYTMIVEYTKTTD